MSGFSADMVRDSHGVRVRPTVLATAGVCGVPWDRNSPKVSDTTMEQVEDASAPNRTEWGLAAGGQSVSDCRILCRILAKCVSVRLCHVMPYGFRFRLP